MQFKHNHIVITYFYECMTTSELCVFSGCAVGDLAGPVIVAFCAGRVFHLNP